jgi:hypothetical protein
VGEPSGSKQTGILTTTTATGAAGRHVSFATVLTEEIGESHSIAQEQAASTTRVAPTTNTEASTLMQSSPASDHRPQDSDSVPSSPPTPANNSKANLIPLPLTNRNGSASKTYSERGALHLGLPLPKKKRSTSLSSLARSFSKESKGKGRATPSHGGPHTHPSPYPSPVQEPPAPPVEVLNRNAAEEPNTSAGAAAILQQDLQPATQDTDVIMRDRMLVRILHSKQGGFPKYMDEVHLAEITNIKQEEWGEFIVVWRRGRIELYEDYVSARSYSLLFHVLIVSIS